MEVERTRTIAHITMSLERCEDASFWACVCLSSAVCVSLMLSMCLSALEDGIGDLDNCERFPLEFLT